MSDTKEYVKISVEDLQKLHRMNAEKTAYITKLELALESVKKQLANTKAANEEETR